MPSLSVIDPDAPVFTLSKTAQSMLDVIDRLEHQLQEDTTTFPSMRRRESEQLHILAVLIQNNDRQTALIEQLSATLKALVEKLSDAEGYNA